MVISRYAQCPSSRMDGAHDARQSSQVSCRIVGRGIGPFDWASDCPVVVSKRSGQIAGPGRGRQPARSVGTAFRRELRQAARTAGPDRESGRVTCHQLRPDRGGGGRWSNLGLCDRRTGNPALARLEQRDAERSDTPYSDQRGPGRNSRQGRQSLAECTSVDGSYQGQSRQADGFQHAREWHLAPLASRAGSGLRASRARHCPGYRHRVPPVRWRT